MFGKRSAPATEPMEQGAPARSRDGLRPDPAAAVFDSWSTAFEQEDRIAPPRPSGAYQDARSVVFGALIDSLDLGQMARLDSETAREEIRDVVGDIIGLKNIAMSMADQEDLLDDICNDVLGLGPLEALMAREDVTAIMVNGPSRVFIEIEGRVRETGARFRDRAQLLNVCQRLAGQAGATVGDANPICEARLSDGTLVNVVMPPVAPDGPILTIRKAERSRPTLVELTRAGTVSGEVAAILEIAVAARCNILVSGTAGAGENGVLNALALLIPDTERVVLCGDAADIPLGGPQVIRLTAPAGLSGQARVSVTDLVLNARYMHADRIVTGELAGPEAAELLRAMAEGEDGSMAAIRAGSAREALARLEALAAAGDLAAARSTVADAVDLIVHVARFRDGRQRVAAISQPTGVGADGIELADLVRLDLPAGGSARYRVAAAPGPALLERVRAVSLERRLATVLEVLGDEARLPA